MCEAYIEDAANAVAWVYHVSSQQCGFQDWFPQQKHLRTILFDTKNHVLKVHTVYIGSLNNAQVRVGELFREAIRMNSAALTFALARSASVVAHNHPSGDPTASPEDVQVTRQTV